MKTHNVRNSILAGIGLAALLVYVLACTSFSPDDSKVLYPAFDVKSGGTTAMVYDRKTGKSEPVFVAANLAELEGTNGTARLLRPQWLPDGKRILVAWQGKAGDDDGLELTLVPYGAPAPVQHIWIADSEMKDAMLMLPLPLVGSRVFLAGD